MLPRSVLAMLSVNARADVIPPGYQECVGKTAGAPVCSKLDYPNWARESASAPPTRRYDCILCEPADGSPAGGAPDSDSGCGCAAGGGDAKRSSRVLRSAAACERGALERFGL